MRRLVCTLALLFALAWIATLSAWGGKPVPPPGNSSGVILYWDYFGAPASPCVYMLNWDGSNYHALDTTGAYMWPLTDVSNLGAPRFLVYTYRVASLPGAVVSNTFAVPETGGTIRNLINDPRFSTGGSLSQDGSRIAFNGYRYDDNGYPIEWGIYVADLVYSPGDFMPSAIQNPIRICGMTAKSGNVSWSPDAQWLVFDDLGTYDLFVVSASGGTPVNITNSSVKEINPCWSPQGVSRIAFARQVTGPSGGTKRWNIYTVNPNGTGLAAATSSTNTETAYNDYPTWSPDGGQIAFAGRKQSYGNSAIFRTSADGKSLSLRLTAYLSGQSPWGVFCRP